MTILHEIIAINGSKDGKKITIPAKIKAMMGRMTSQPTRLQGQTRRYTPVDDEGYTYPDENKQVETDVMEVISRLGGDLADLWNHVATQDVANLTATADIVVEGEVILRDVPTSFLLYLAKQLELLRTTLESFPTLDEGDTWQFDVDLFCFKGETRKTVKTEKVPYNHVLAPATEQHPAQVELFRRDVPVGTWATTKLSGAMPIGTKNKLLSRLQLYVNAVKMARERANQSEVEMKNFGSILVQKLLTPPDDI